MKLQISKNSILKCAILTVVTFLCSVGMSVGQTYTVEASCDNPGNITFKTGSVLLQDGNDYYFEFSNSGGWPGFKIYKDDSNIRNISGYACDNISIGFFDDGSFYYAPWNSVINMGNWAGRFGIPEEVKDGRVTLKYQSNGSYVVSYRMLWDDSKNWSLEPYIRNGKTTTNSGSFENCGSKYVFFVEKKSDEPVCFQVIQDGKTYTKSFFNNSSITQQSWDKVFWEYSGPYVNQDGKVGIWIVMDPQKGDLVTANSKPNCGAKVTSASVSISEGSHCLSSNPMLSASYEGEGISEPAPYFQWYQGDTPISGATSVNFRPSVVGDYKVRIYAKQGDESTSALSVAVPITGSTISTATLSAGNTVFCPGNTTLLVDDDAACSPSGYPQYVWYKNGKEVETTTSPSYLPSSVGNWEVVVKADKNTTKKSNTITLSSPNPSITVSPSELSMQALMSGEASSGSLTVTLDNSCSTLKAPVITGANASMYSVIENEDGTYTITFTPGDKAGSYPASVTFASNDDATPQTIALKGKVVSCMSSDVASFDFSTKSIGSTDGGVSITTPLNTTDQQWADQNNTLAYYNVSDSVFFAGRQFELAGNTGNCFQFYRRNALFSNTPVLSLSGIPTTGFYAVQFTIGNLGNYESELCTTDVMLNGISIGSVPYRGTTTLSGVVRGSSTADITLTTETGNTTNSNVFFIDEVSVLKVCPPEVDYSTISNECDVNPSFTAEVTKGSADVVKYEWYILEESQSPVLVATHNSNSLTDIFSQSAEIGTGKKVKVVVTDANGLSADVEYEINCGPVIDDIIAPAEICPDGNLTLTIPSYTSSSTVTDAGWEIAESATATRSEWTELSSLNTVPETYKNWYIRYFVENAEGRGKSNAVQITMFDAPVVDPIFVDDICSGDAFVLTAPSVEYDAAQDIEEWQYSTQSDFSETTVFTTGNTFTAGTYYIRYAATDACTTTYATTTAVVHDPSLSVTEYPTYMRVAGTQQVVADAPVLDATCVGELSYSITDGNINGYFSIDEATGVITMTSAATETGDFPITVTITDGTTTITKDLIITITEEPTLMLQCSGETDYYAYTKYQKLNIQNVVTSNFVNDDVTLTLSGSAASYFTLTPSSVTKNTPNVPVTIAQNDFFTGVGDYTLKLTATTEGLTKECNVNIHVKNLNITDYINDQTNCSSDAPSLMVEVTGEDATNLPLTYQWYNNGVAVSGATSKTFKPTVDGDYYCEVSTGGTLLYKSKSADVFFVKNMPVLSFDETAAPIPSEVFCTEEVGAVMKVTLNGADVTSDYKRFWWLIGTESDGLTSDNIHTFSFDCASNDYTATIGAYIMENTTKCVIKMAKAVTIKKMANTYYYYGPTGDNSDVTDRKNWYSCKDKSTGELIIPNVNYIVGKVLKENVDLTLNNQYGNYERTLTCSCPEVDPATNVFMGDGCKYIINKDDVKLKADQTWTVSGVGAKVSIGDGNWTSDFTSVGDGWSKEGKNAGYGVPNSYGERIETLNGTDRVDKFTSIANHDYRDCSKTFDILGELNLYDGITLDVQNGSSLIVETDKGNFKFGTMATDVITFEDGNGNTTYNTTVKPGSSVTYKGEGAKNIRQGEYSQLYIDTDDDVVFEKDAKIGVVQVLKYDNSPAFDKIDPNGSTILYEGTTHQDVASMPYSTLQLESATNKTLTGNISVDTKLNVGAGAVLVAGNKTIDINASGDDAVVFVGLFEPGTSTVNYNSDKPTKVAAVNYYNLNLGEGNRTLSDENIIGIAGNFTTSSTATYNVEGSTVEFNGTGTVTQHIPNFEFYNLIVNSSALSNNTDNSFNDAYCIVMDGDVTIDNRVLFTRGVVKTNDHAFLVKNTLADAVGQGYFSSTKDASFVMGELTRNFPENVSSDAGSYYFPIGDKDGYKPFMISQITTSGASQATVGVSGGMEGKFIDESGENTVSTPFSWHLVADENYVDGRVAVSTSNGLNNANAVVYGEGQTGVFENIFGSAVGTSIMYTQKEGAGYYALATRNATSRKYYYNCSGSTDASQIEAWFTGKNGTGTQASKFDEPDTEWVIECGTTITAPLVIVGANSKVTLDIPSGESLKLNSKIEFITATHKQGTIEIGKSGEMMIDYGFTMDANASAENRTTIVNNGKLDLRNAEIRLINSYVTNNGMIYSENVNWEITSDANQEPKNLIGNSIKHTKFINNGTIHMVNANLNVPEGKGGDGNVVHIRNAAGAVWLIDNTNAAGAKHVDFDGCNFAHEEDGLGAAYVDFQCGSSFVVKKSDMKMVYASAKMVQKIGGEIVVEDGNLYVTRHGGTGGNFTLEQTCGAMYLVDTDNTGDGMLQLQGGGGGYEVNIEGTLYVMGMVEQGGSGAKFNVKDGGTVFIGNIGALMPSYTWQFQINVDPNGTLYYCGNRSAGPDNVGTNAGNLFYAGNYYYGTDPIAERDFQNNSPGTFEKIFVGELECMAEYREGLPDTDNATLLPIELTSLYGVCDENGDVVIHWQTASEQGNRYFTILRSFDGVHFEELDIVWGAGTTTEFHNYEYFDTDDNTGIVYYKLRQTDYDGNTTESKVIAVQTCGPNAQFRITEDQIDIFFKHPEESSFVVITSITGQIFYSKSFRNTEAARIAAPQRKGIYIISVIDSKTITSEKFIR